MFAELQQALWSAIPDQGYILAVFLLSLRLAAVFAMTPLLAAFSVPGVVRVLLVVALAAALALGVPSESMTAALSLQTGELVAACFFELSLGATLALGIITAFAAISFAGRLVDQQVGFGMAQVFDPLTRRQIPVLTSAFDKLGVVVFFLADGPHALLRGIAFSLERFPLGHAWPISASAPWIIKQAGALFSLGFALAAPVVVCLLLVELALGVVARNLPQMNMFVIGMPVKIIVGLVALSLWVGGMGAALNRVYGSIYRTWDGIFSAAPAAATAVR
ncbi:flagellar biosynthetic protein FliR [Caenimonas koreensis]|uniref:Flagellar biosynthetic protein FliR n=1 Tax=Caenimonas koreensis DSM 17982 TaxID=1121255 RepID=A0A844BB70_9BURK|nr:flagellar biosynthetic protein FliR [Caenimonas koreensis]MRD48697.1 flagellar biosynthetic protein FliR [Caenimonas koreensis DSM 17982]